MAFYQPQQRLDGKVDGMEALARWRGPGDQVLLPAAFLHCFNDEATQFALTRAMCLHALHMASEIAQSGLHLRVAVNITPNLVALPHFVPWLIERLAEGNEGNRLTLELLEVPYAGSRGVLIHALEVLRSYNVRIAVDDFGTGASTMCRVEQLPINEWKMARTVVAGVSKRPRAAARLLRLMRIGRRRALRTVLEGIETEADATWVRSHCPPDTVIQGFAVAAPMSFQRAHRWLADRTNH